MTAGELMWWAARVWAWRERSDGGDICRGQGVRGVDIAVLVDPAAAQAGRATHRGTFVLPDAPAERPSHVEVDEVTFEALLDGIGVEEKRPKTKKVRGASMH